MERTSALSPSVTRRRLLTTIALTWTALAACAPPAAPVPTAPAAPTTPPTAVPAPTAAPKPAAPAAGAPTPVTKPALVIKPMTWRYATFPANLQDTPFLAGIEKGFYREVGANVEPSFLTNSVLPVQGLIAGEYDLISLNFLGEIAVIAGGAPIKVLGSSANRLNQIMASRKSIATVKDLAGKTIGHSGAGSLPDIVIDLKLAKAGLKPEDVTKVAAGTPPQLFQALQAGKIDATELPLDFIPDLEKEPDLKVLVIGAEELPTYVTSGIAISDKTLKEQPDEVVALLAAIARSIRFIYENRAETVKIMAGKLAKDEPTTGANLDLYVKYKIWPKNLDLTLEEVGYMQDVNIGLGKQSARLPADKILDATFREKALAVIGKV